jgi:hypothetical protein
MVEREARQKGKQAVEKLTQASEREVWRPTRSTSCKLQREDQKSPAPKSKELSLSS